MAALFVEKAWNPSVPLPHDEEEANRRSHVYFSRAGADHASYRGEADPSSSRSSNGDGKERKAEPKKVLGFKLPTALSLV